MSNSTNPSLQPNQSSAQTPQQMQQELTSLRREKAALSAMLWELVRQASPETHWVEVLPTASDPLWQLAFLQSSDAKSGKVRILAGTIVPITESEKKRVVRLLRGSSKPMADALTELKLERFPPSYVEREVSKHLVWKPADKTSDAPLAIIGFWESVTAPPFGEKVKNFVGLPKS